jgi:hypothetical protein
LFKAEALVGRAFLRGADRWITKTPLGMAREGVLYHERQENRKKESARG